MRYGIVPRLNAPVVYPSGFHTLNEAKDYAEKLCKEQNIEVVVYELVGTFKPCVSWHEHRIDQD